MAIYIEMHPSEMRVANSPTKRIITDAKRGIKDYHCMHSNADGIMKYRDLSCPCPSCIIVDFTACSEYLHVGEWIDYKGQDHMDYESIPLKENNPRKRRRLN